jgi:hypothetical protein
MVFKEFLTLGVIMVLTTLGSAGPSHSRALSYDNKMLTRKVRKLTKEMGNVIFSVGPKAEVLRP